MGAPGGGPGWGPCELDCTSLLSVFPVAGELNRVLLWGPQAAWTFSVQGQHGVGCGQVLRPHDRHAPPPPSHMCLCP